MKVPMSQAIENYLKAIYELEEDYGQASTSLLAIRLGVQPASVTGMVQKLARSRPKLVHYERHHGASLTPAGRKVALEVIRHHRLLELYLAESLGYEWDRVHDEAEQLEHVISEEFEDKIAALLGDPTTDPHGDPIPSKSGQVAATSRRSLSAVAAGETVRLARVRDDDPALLRRLTELGLSLHSPLRVLSHQPEGALQIEVGGRRHSFDRAMAERVFVREA